MRVGASLAERSAKSLRGVGPKLKERLTKLGIETVQDLLFHLPLRYEDRTKISPIGALRPGTHALVAGEVQAANVKLGRRRSLIARIADGTGHIDVRFFYFGQAQKQALTRGARVQCYGEARRGPGGLEMVHPEYHLLEDEQEVATDPYLTPVYPTTEGLTQSVLRRLVTEALRHMREPGALPDLLPEGALGEQLLPTLPDALNTLHAPYADDDRSKLERARQRLSFEELLANHLSHRAIRAQMQSRHAPAMRGSGTTERAFRKRLGFTLTGAQQRVVAEVHQDLATPVPMYRLVQGDVGSGKTVVAALAAVRAIEAEQQTAVMAPTELLAEQHLRQFVSWFEPLGFKVLWLGGKQTARSRRSTLEALAAGRAHIAVGTHALFQDAVRFSRLGLVIIDEQHRFGVDQRHALLNKGGDEEGAPHQLIMTATPIPRTLAMTAYAHLDVSAIDELPPGRQRVDTAVLPAARRPALIERIAAACAEGQQAYWVCPLIEESEAVEAEAAEETARSLSEALPNLTIGLVHGRMKSSQRDEIMARFRAADIDLLVATTVIEVGVDVPNASLMIIENAERMGLSQLHQLRGRVGRGNRKSACVLVYQGKLGALAKSRLGVLRDSNDGFEIAAKDLELRGPGEVLGTKQTGELQMKVADVGRDRMLLDRVAGVADALLTTAPENAPALVKRWKGARVAYGEVG